MKRVRTTEATLNVQGWVDTKIVAGALVAYTSQYAEPPASWSDFVRWAISRAAIEIPKTSGEAIALIESSGLTLNQLKRRGDGIRKSMSQEAQRESSGEISKRAEDIAGALEEGDMQ